MCDDSDELTRNDIYVLSGASCVCDGDTYCGNGELEAQNEEGDFEECEPGIGYNMAEFICYLPGCFLLENVG